VVIASRGYPDSSESGQPIRGVGAASEMALVFHAGTAWRDGTLVTAGGRVLTIVGRGATYDDAIARAYAAVANIQFEGMQYRHDIGRKAQQVRA
jgi:phosphoribosylamine--glycine ligase